MLLAPVLLVLLALSAINAINSTATINSSGPSNNSIASIATSVLVHACCCSIAAMHAHAVAFHATALRA